MYDWKKIKEKWVTLVDEKKSCGGKSFFRKKLMNKNGNTMCFQSSLDERGKVVYEVEMYNLNPKTGKPLCGSPIWEQHTFTTEKELLDKVGGLKQRY
jgi:hypothetical protein